MLSMLEKLVSFYIMLHKFHKIFQGGFTTQRNCRWCRHRHPVLQRPVQLPKHGHRRGFRDDHLQQGEWDRRHSGRTRDGAGCGHRQYVPRQSERVHKRFFNIMSHMLLSVTHMLLSVTHVLLSVTHLLLSVTHVLLSVTHMLLYVTHMLLSVTHMSLSVTHTYITFCHNLPYFS